MPLLNPPRKARASTYGADVLVHVIARAAVVCVLVLRCTHVLAEVDVGGVGFTTTTTTTTTNNNNTNNSLEYHAHIHQEKTGSKASFNVTVDAVMLEESRFFIGKLFARYGNMESLKQEKFEVLLENLGLGQNRDHDKQKRSVFPDTHVHTTHNECLSVSEMLEAFHLGGHHQLTGQQFTYLCPALVYQLDGQLCQTHSHTHFIHEGDKTMRVGKERLLDLSRIPAKVWGFSTVAVLVISLVGLLGVAVIPIMQKVFYNHLLQFLVALAVGALSGDALLHLLPHSIMAAAEEGHAHGTEEEEEHNHTAAAWKGLVALAGILFFFIMERLLTIITVIKRNQKSKKQTRKKRCETFCDIESNKKSVGAKLSHRQSSEDECDRTVMLVHPNKALKSFADTAHEEMMHQCDEDKAGGTAVRRSSDADEVKMELVALDGDHAHLDKDHAHSDTDQAYPSHGHSHSAHGHSHSVPNSVAAVAWMVILGDGIHNFSDGLAIGAAFANSITGGFSTSIAVFCHELPHEIGDFAVLLRAGMTVKQAIFYNCLSSILCFMGMLIGVAIGNISTASLWIFAAVGGMFLYIALVDMLPEMSSVDPKKGENPFLHLLLQVLGILLGTSIMLIIALFEHDLKRAFE